MQNILIMGSGAVGGYYGAQFASRDGLDVTFVARGAHLEAMQQNGLRITGKEDLWIKNVKAIDDPILASHSPDLILITVKSFDTRRVIQQIQPVTGSHTLILSIQNGLENYDMLADVFGELNVVRGFCKIGVEITQPGVISYAGMSAIVFGEENGAITDRILQIREIMEYAGLHYTISSNIRKESWLKFMWNGIFNMLTGIAMVTTDRILNDEHAYETAWDLFYEMQQVAKAEGIIISDREGTGIIDGCKIYGAFRTSTYQDRLKNKPLEYDAFCGYIVRKARQHNIKVPATSTLLSLYKLIPDSSRQSGNSSHGL